MNNKTIDNIVWWIPFRSLRNSLRDYLNELYIIKNEINHIKEICLNTHKVLNGDMFGTVLWSNAFYRMREFMIDNPLEFKKLLEKFKRNLDLESLEILDLWFLQIKSLVNSKSSIPLNFFVSYGCKFFTDEQKIVWASRNNILNDIKNRYINKYDLSDIYVSLHVHYYECGIVYLPNFIKNRFKGGIAIDGGAWIGDSSIMFLEEYQFKCIHSFEPIKSIFNKLSFTIQKYNLADRIKAHNYAIGDINSVCDMFFNDAGSFVHEKSDDSIPLEKVETVSLDEFFKNNEDNISLIKLDVEGFEERALVGAINIIKKHKPVLIVSCYHDYISFAQMFRLKEYIEDLNLGYKILFRGLEPNSNLEYNLICYIE